MRILFLSHFVTIDLLSLASALREKGHESDIFCFDASLLEDYGELFRRAYAIDWTSRLVDLGWPLRVITRRRFWSSVGGMVWQTLFGNHELVYARAGVNWWCAVFAWWLRVVRRIPLVYMPYDMALLRRRPQDIPWIEAQAEHFLLGRAEALVHKNDPDSLHLLSALTPKIPDRTLQFLPYAPASLMIDLPETRPPPHTQPENRLYWRHRVS